MALQPPNQKIVVGIDEAGYGPNLGPLVIGGSVWRVPRQLDEAQFSKFLAQEQFSCRSFTPHCLHIPLGDSKKLYRSRDCLRTLEIGLLAQISNVGTPPQNLLELLDLLDGIPQLGSLPPWYRNLNQVDVPQRQVIEELQVEDEPAILDEIARLSTQSRQRLDRHGISVVGIAVKVISEPEFNEQVAQLDSKGLLLSQASLEVVSQLLTAEPDLPAEVFCDRQGGRTNYLPMLTQWMPDTWFEETVRSKPRCSYKATTGRSLNIHFSIGGDSFAPTALASMAAKYVRERIMESLNSYWFDRLPNLQPTAGYPVDAARFRNSIEKTALAEGLSENLWWRSR